MMSSHQSLQRKTAQEAFAPMDRGSFDQAEKSQGPLQRFAMLANGSRQVAQSNAYAAIAQGKQGESLSPRQLKHKSPETGGNDAPVQRYATGIHPSSEANDGVVQLARIVGKSVGFGMHHWEIQYQDTEGGNMQLGVISTLADRDAKGVTGKVQNLAKGKATVRVADKHLAGYEQVGDLNDPNADVRIEERANKLKGTQISFNQITNNCQDFAGGVWNECGAKPDSTPYMERNKLIHELTRAPTEEEAMENLANSYMFM